MNLEKAATGLDNPEILKSIGTPPAARSTTSESTNLPPSSPPSQRTLTSVSFPSVLVTQLGAYPPDPKYVTGTIVVEWKAADGPASSRDYVVLCDKSSETADDHFEFEYAFSDADPPPSSNQDIVGVSSNKIKVNFVVLDNAQCEVRYVRGNDDCFVGMSDSFVLGLESAGTSSNSLTAATAATTLATPTTVTTTIRQEKKDETASPMFSVPPPAPTSAPSPHLPLLTFPGSHNNDKILVSIERMKHIKTYQLTIVCCGSDDNEEIKVKIKGPTKNVLKMKSDGEPILNVTFPEGCTIRAEHVQYFDDGVDADRPYFLVRVGYTSDGLSKSDGEDIFESLAGYDVATTLDEANGAACRCVLCGSLSPST